MIKKFFKKSIRGSLSLESALIILGVVTLSSIGLVYLGDSIQDRYINYDEGQYLLNQDDDFVLYVTENDEEGSYTLQWTTPTVVDAPYTVEVNDVEVATTNQNEYIYYPSSTGAKSMLVRDEHGRKTKPVHVDTPAFASYNGDDVTVLNGPAFPTVGGPQDLMQIDGSFLSAKEKKGKCSSYSCGPN